MRTSAKVAGLMMLGLLVCGLGAGMALADDNHTGHYINGVEGIKGASLPPPGMYWRLYNVYYTASEDSGATLNGDEIPADLDLTVFAFVNRLIWISGVTFLGGNLGMDALVPVVYTDLKMGGNKVDDQFAVGDINVEPVLLAWHGARYDAAVGLSVWTPVGKYEAMPTNAPPNASPGKDFWTFMLTAGGTAYFDAAKTWSASILGRYETHTEKGEMNVTLGDDLHFEWGIAKTCCKVWDVGVAGYCQWQVTDDSGADVTWNRSVHDRVFGVGPEISTFCPKTRLFISLRSEWEFGAEDRTQGNVTALTLTKIL